MVISLPVTMKFGNKSRRSTLDSVDQLHAGFHYLLRKTALVFSIL
jgi:hypothetical protein